MKRNPSDRTSGKTLFIMIVVCAAFAIAITPFVQHKINDIFAPEESSSEYCSNPDNICLDVGPTPGAPREEPPRLEDRLRHPELYGIPADGATCDADGNCASSMVCDAQGECSMNGKPVTQD